MRKYLLPIFILLVITFIFFTLKFLSNKNNLNIQPKEESEENIIPKEEIPNPKPEEKQIEYITFDEEPASKDAIYFEKVVKIGTEYLYFAYPLKIEKEKPPRLVMYSHGSNTTISMNFDDPFMKDMQMYGKYFTKYGFAFGASSMHGANWGNDLSVEDIKSSYEYISNKYPVKEKINILGFSMGGLSSFNYIFKYPKTVNVVALLAPTSRTYTQENFQKISKIKIEIWHGDADVNVPYSLSTSLLSRAESFGLKNINLNTLTGKTHFDLDTELRSEILQFMKANE